VNLYQRLFANFIDAIYLLKNSQYVMSEMSEIFPDVPVVQIICSIIERGWEVGSFQALDEFQTAVAEGIYQDLI